MMRVLGGELDFNARAFFEANDNTFTAMYSIC